MSRWITTAAWVLFTALMYLIFVAAVRPWLSLPGFGNIGFIVIFVLFALVHCFAREGLERTAFFFGLTATVSYVLEEVGVRTAVIYGPYHYSDMLGPKLGHVPVLIPLAWFMMIYPSWTVAQALVLGVDTSTLPGLTVRAGVAAMVMTAWDAVMDPGMASAGNWVWERGGPYFGVPFRNYFGWMLTTFLVYWGAGLLWRGDQRRTAGVTKTFAAFPILVYAFYTVSYITPRRIPALQVIACFAMGQPALLALVRVWMNRREA